MTADARVAFDDAEANPRRGAWRRGQRKTIAALGASGLVAVALVVAGVAQDRAPMIVLDGHQAPAVQVRARDAEGFSVTVGDLRSSRGRWEHEMTISNDSDRTLYVDDARISVFVGDRELLVGSENCGYATGHDDGVQPACLLDYRPFELGAGDDRTVRVALWQGLSGMTQPRQRRYELQTALSYRFTEPFGDHDDLPTQTAHVTLVYDLDDPAP